ncbi:MAG TPA: protein kinase [Nannocystis sp.]
MNTPGQCAKGEDAAPREPEPTASANSRGFSFCPQPEPSARLLLTPTPSRAGEVLDGRFELLRQIGRGGMSVVYVAHDRQLPQPVAIKIITSRAPEIEQRFLDEVEILGTVSHPNLVRPLGKGRTPDGHLYMAMEYVRGETLSARLADLGALSWRDAVAVGIQVGDVLQCLHAAGVLHRDIKPTNIMLCSRGDVVIKVIDLGCAKKQPDAWPEGASRRFQTDLGVAVGTPPYLPPEAGLVPPDPRFDVFGLAATIYELCTGKSVELGTYRPIGRDAPPGLDAVLAAALHGDADERTPSIDALLAGLRRVRDDGERAPLFDGRYELIRPLGSGAKAEVFLAHHRQAGRDLALKILDHKHKSGEERERMRREARVLSLLRHPAFPALYDFHEHDGRMYLALELVTGQIATKYDDNPLRPAHVIEIGIQLAQALIALHELGVVHRDIHGGNVLIDFECGPVARPIVHLIDLGMCELLPAFYARVIRYGTPPEHRVALGTGGIETLAWTAPEAARDRKWTEKSDVWSVARLLFRLLTGRIPFPGRTDVPPASPRRWVPSCSEALEHALLAALNPDPAKRPDAAQLLDLLAFAAEEQAAEDGCLDEPAEQPAARSPARDTRASSSAQPEPSVLATRAPTAPQASAPKSSSQPRALVGAESRIMHPGLDPAPRLATPAIEATADAHATADAASTPARSWWKATACAAFLTAAALLVLVLFPETQPGPTTAERAPGSPDHDAHVVEQNSIPVAPEVVAPAHVPADAPAPDLDQALANAEASLRACARQAGREVMLELRADKGDTAFSSVIIMTTDAEIERCFRDVVTTLRFAAPSAPITRMPRIQP